MRFATALLTLFGLTLLQAQGSPAKSGDPAKSGEGGAATRDAALTKVLPGLSSPAP